jgi:hypothetical protein
LNLLEEIEKKIENISRIEYLDKSTAVHRLPRNAIQGLENN